MTQLAIDGRIQYTWKDAYDVQWTYGGNDIEYYGEGGVFVAAEMTMPTPSLSPGVGVDYAVIGIWPYPVDNEEGTF